MNHKADLHKIKAFVFDVDGVLTERDVLVSENGEFLRRFNTKDGYALRCAVQKGYKTGIITGAASETIIKRFIPFNITDIYLNSYYKLPDFNHFIGKHGLNVDEVLYMGDDIPDIEIMKICGMSACPADAVPEVKAASRYISHFAGGKGCVRDVIEQVMKVRNHWDTENLKY